LGRQGLIDRRKAISQESNRGSTRLPSLARTRTRRAISVKSILLSFTGVYRLDTVRHTGVYRLNTVRHRGVYRLNTPTQRCLPTEHCPTHRCLPTGHCPTHRCLPTEHCPTQLLFIVKCCLFNKTLHVSATNGHNQALYTKHENRSVGLLPIVSLVWYLTFTCII
jgi:hypothetical protein